MDFPYRYETHCHTSETSKCGSSSGAEMARYFYELGYAGIFVTDHFFNGNTTVSPELPWEQRVEEFCVGYENAKKEGDRLGIDVFFGWEYSYGWCHLLTYNLTKEWLRKHPDLLEWSVTTYLDRVREDGGFVVHAHPFREGVEVVTLLPNKVDAIETPNASRSDAFNGYGKTYAEMMGLPMTAGSDIHKVDSSRLCGVALAEKLTCSEDYARAVLERKVSLFDNRMK